MALSASQQDAFDAFVRGESFFLTGDAGTGKSELIKKIRMYCGAKKIALAVTATTGIAAVAIEGRTIHSLMRIVPDDVNLSKEELWARNSKNKYLCDSIKKYKALIIDEVSMMDVDFFEKVDWLLVQYRRSGSPFGGIQTVLCGDFFQLPPVYKPTDGRPRFIFQMPLFYRVVPQRYELTQVFRQTDVHFQSLLGRMRRGILTASDKDTLATRIMADVSIEGIRPTKLFAKNVDVDSINSTEQSKLDGPLCTFEAVNQGYTSLPNVNTSKIEGAMAKFIKDQNVGTVNLKVGAQVLLTYNLDVSSGLCNGSRGVVIAFEAKAAKPDPAFVWPDKDLPRVRFIGNKETPIEMVVPYVHLARIDRDAGVEVFADILPLRLAWATTIHKSQGLSLDCVEASIDSSVFEDGQAYVAMSRARSLQGLSLSKWCPEVVRANDAVKSFYSTPMSVLKLTYNE